MRWPFWLFCPCIRPFFRMRVSNRTSHPWERGVFMDAMAYWGVLSMEMGWFRGWKTGGEGRATRAKKEKALTCFVSA